jgi:hypothetical protein
MTPKTRFGIDMVNENETVSTATRFSHQTPLKRVFNCGQSSAMTKGEISRLRGNIAKDYAAVVDHRPPTVRAEPPCKKNTHALAEAPASAAALQ